MSTWVTLPSGERLNLDRIVHISALALCGGTPEITATVPTGIDPEASSYLGEIAFRGDDALALAAYLDRTVERLAVPTDTTATAPRQRLHE